MNIVELFTIPIHQHFLEIDNSSLVLYSYNLKQKDKGRYISNEGGWQSNDLNLNSLELQPLIENIKKVYPLFLDNCKLKKTNYRLNMWININNYKDFNILHSHSNSTISGVYYVKTNEKSGSICFQHPGEPIFGEYKVDEYNKINSNIYCLPSLQNTLYLFPSTLKHFVRPNQSNEDRISIAFNLEQQIHNENTQ